MIHNSFFKPTPIYKEFLILDLLEKNKNITQREISESIGISVSMVNSYLDEYEKKGYVLRDYKSVKTIEYFVSKIGNERKKLLNIWFLQASQEIYKSAKDNITIFLFDVYKKGYKNILLYGAGQVAEIILDVIRSCNEMPISVLAIVDDDFKKIGTSIMNTPIIAIDETILFSHDGILISSYSDRKVILEKLRINGFDKKKILHFFD